MINNKKSILIKIKISTNFVLKKKNEINEPRLYMKCIQECIQKWNKVSIQGHYTESNKKKKSNTLFKNIYTLLTKSILYELS